MLYFAYGSNLNLDQMAWRCPGAEMVGPATLYGYRLAFRGPLDIQMFSPASVPGFVFDVTDPADWEALDAYEGYPHLYNRIKLRVTLGSGRRVRAIVYIMTPETKARRGEEPPGRGYLSIVREGYKQCGLSGERGVLDDALEKAMNPRPGC